MMSQGANERKDGSLLSTVLRAVTQFVAQQPTLTLWVVAVICGASIMLTARYIGFKTERADLIDPKAEFHQRWIDYSETFGGASDIVVVVEAEQSHDIKNAINELGQRLNSEPEFFTDVLYKIETEDLRGKGLQYLSPRQLEAGLRRIDEYSPIIRGQWDLTRVDRMYYRLRDQYAARGRPPRSDQRDPLLEHASALSGSMAAYLKNPGDFRSPWPNLLPVAREVRSQANGTTYMMNRRGDLGFLKVKPTEADESFDGASRSIERLRALIAQMAPQHANVKISLTGIPVLENDEMLRSKSDMLKASLISFAGVGLLLFLGFRGFRHPALALVMLAVGMIWAFGFTTLAVGHLNILSVSFAAILIGLGIDFAIHFLARYLELRHNGKELKPALAETSTGVGVGVVTAAVTTALAFFCATFTEFLGVAELGIIAGGGILLCAAATFIVLPALIALADRNVEPRKLPTPLAGNALRTLTSRFPKTVMAVCVLMLLGVGSQIFRVNDGEIELKVRYDYNLLNLQAKGLESVEIQKRIFQEAGDSLLYAVSIANSPEEARQLRRRFEALPTVHHAEELASRLPAYHPRQTRLLIQSYRAQLARLPRSVPQLPRPDPAEVGKAMEQLYLQVRRSQHPTAVRVASRLNDFLNQYEELPLRQQIRFINAFQQRSSRAMLGQLHALANATDTRPVRMADLPVELTSRFLGDEGKWLVQIFPREEIWDVEPLERFVKDVRSVDPNVTGTPLQNYEAAGQIKDSYQDASVYALVVICLVLLVDFVSGRHKWLALLPPLAIVLFAAALMQARRMEINYVMMAIAYVAMAAAIAGTLDFRNVRDVLLAMLPPVTGGVLMFGLLGLMGIDLNPANLIVLPLVLGIGVDDGVHVVHDFRSQRSGYRMSSSTINAITLTSLTSMIGFGSMMLAAHRGLYSVGLVLVVGVGSCLFVSLVMLPTLLTLLSRRESQGNSSQSSQQGGSQKKPPKQRSVQAA